MKLGLTRFLLFIILLFTVKGIYSLLEKGRDLQSGFISEEKTADDERN